MQALDDLYLVELEDDELTRRDCEELIQCIEKYEQGQKEKLDSEVKVFTAKECSQEFLKSLIPKRR